MIFGIGSDLVDIRRIDRAVRQPRFIQRIFTSAEQALMPMHPAKQAAFWAKRFAAKEAWFKALSVGRGFGFSWQDVSVLQTPTGQPLGICKGRVHDYLSNQCGKYRIHITLTDEPPFAQAFVVIEKISA